MKQVFVFLFFLSVHLANSQKQVEVVFYNVENLYDNQIDSTKKYSEFNPGGKNGWDEVKYKKKINDLAKVIAATSENLPVFVGLAEIENSKVCLDLAAHPLLKKGKYELIHFDSKDFRGIDVAFLYQKKEFNLLGFKNQGVRLGKKETRDILIVTGILKTTKDTLAFTVNHWPSRFGGKKSSEISRIKTAKTLKQQMDSLSLKYPQCKIISMGDFNDSPKDSSMKILSTEGKYWNLFADSAFKIGSLKYQRTWYLFDQFVVSKNVISAHKLRLQRVAVFHRDWLLEEDIKNGGLKPRRTFNGPRYNGGISDHLPIVLTLKYD